MYKWYQRAVVCYAFLSDLVETGQFIDTVSTCRWWKRGWCLQELLAPREVLFYDTAWNLRGSRSERRFIISRITSIDVKVLSHELPLKRVPIATRMSWASGRETTRTEDIAYCLLGIFDINLALMYGEEEKAFRRLQLEIVATSSDPSIFSWQLPRHDDGQHDGVGTSHYCGVLATSPAAFGGDLKPMRWTHHQAQERSVTNLGIKSRDLVVTQYSSDEGSMRYVLPLSFVGSRPRWMTAVKLRKCGRETYVREDPQTLLQDVQNFQASEAEKFLLTEVPVEKPLFHMLPGSPFAIAHTRQSVLQIEHSAWISLSRAFPSSTFDVQDKAFFTPVGLIAGHDEYDGALLRLVIRPYYETTAKWATEAFACCLVALGWSSREEHDLTLSLVEADSSHRHSLEMVQSRAAMWDITTADILRLIEEYRIPLAEEIRFHDTEGDRTIVVRVRAVRATDASVCPRPFWKVRITWEEQLLVEQNRAQGMASTTDKSLQGQQQPDVTDHDDNDKNFHHSHGTNGWVGQGSGGRDRNTRPRPHPPHPSPGVS
jgi:hypothetical protein